MVFGSMLAFSVTALAPSRARQGPVTPAVTRSALRHWVADGLGRRQSRFGPHHCTAEDVQEVSEVDARAVDEKGKVKNDSKRWKDGGWSSDGNIVPVWVDRV